MCIRDRARHGPVNAPRARSGGSRPSGGAPRLLLHVPEPPPRLVVASGRSVACRAANGWPVARAPIPARSAAAHR
eukprot:14661765-Alexandrium_andersonii.AAC.1